MKAVVIKEFGGPEQLTWTEVDAPRPAAGDVAVPGLEVSGRISAVGSDVSGWRVGDQVCALLTGGGYARRCRCPRPPRGTG